MKHKRIKTSKRWRKRYQCYTFSQTQIAYRISTHVFLIFKVSLTWRYNIAFKSCIRMFCEMISKVTMGSWGTSYPDVGVKRTDLNSSGFVNHEIDTWVETIEKRTQDEAWTKERETCWEDTRFSGTGFALPLLTQAEDFSNRWTIWPILFW